MADDLITKRALAFYEWLERYENSVPQAKEAMDCIRRVAGKLDRKEALTESDCAETLGYIAGYGFVHNFYEHVMAHKKEYIASILAFVMETSR